ncbi:hypothetical protein C8R46DRAFT_1070338 [Mycena filopes]|nr:hypothetical protein C8R46DRAFT_1070338 [Mycena filopes]
MAFHSADPETVKEGPVSMKKAGLLSSWRGWTDKFIVLKARSLTIYKNRFAPETAVPISLNSITRIERTHSSRKGHCLLLDVSRGTRLLLAFGSDNEAIYALSPLMLFKAQDTGMEFDLENSIIREYSSSADSPDLSSRPSTPRTLPGTKMPGDDDPIPPPPIRQFLLDLEDLRGQKASVCRTCTRRIHHPGNVLRAAERKLIREASEPGGEKPIDLVEIRLRSLLRLKRKWGPGKHDVPDTEEMQTFAEALRDGYVLCQLLNTLHSSPVVRPDARGQDHNNLSLNITKFLAACAAHGLPTEELFLPLDLVEASGYSLARVASTVIALVRSSEALSAPRSAPLKTLDEPPSAIHQATEDLREWIVTFIALTQQQMISEQVAAPVSEGAVEGTVDSDFHLISFITGEAGHDERFRAALERLVRFMVSLDPVWSLVQSSQFRIKLLNISSVLGISNDRRLRDALQKDEADIARLFKLVVSSDIHKKAVLRLKGGSAQNCVDLIQDVLDKGSFQAGDEGFTLKARRLLVKLSQASDTLPSSLFIEGAPLATIYRASYQGQDVVALKRIRVFQRDIGRHKIRQQFCREALLWQRLQNPFVLPFTGIDAESFPSFLCMNGNANVDRRLFEIAQGLAYLHSQQIIHWRSPGVKHFGGRRVSTRASPTLVWLSFQTRPAATHTSHHGGSVRWMGPELHYPQVLRLGDLPADFCQRCLYTGKPPFSDISHDAAVMLRVMAKERPARPCDADGQNLMSDAMWDIVQQCWSHDPSARPSMARVVECMQDVNDDLRADFPSADAQDTARGKPAFQVHRPSRRRPKGSNTVYQSLSF